MKKVAKYVEIEEYVKNKIKNNEILVGHKLPTEQEFCAMFNVSRMTVNKALSSLQNQGYVERVSGKGTFIKAKEFSKSIGSRQSFSQDMRDMGLVPMSELLEYKILLAKDYLEVASKLELGPTDKILYLVRLRKGSDIPICLSYTYLPAKLFTNFDINQANTSLYDYIDSIGMVRGKFNGFISAILPNKEQKELLFVDNDALLKSTHISYLKNNVPFEFIETYYVGSRYHYEYNR